jgi:hypothetical protein
VDNETNSYSQIINEFIDNALDLHIDKRLYEPYHLFVHVVDNSGALVYGHDELMLDGNMRSVDKWANHAAVSLNHSLSISELPPGEYKLGVGMYDLQTGERLKITRGIFAGHDWLLLDNFILE